MSRFLPDDLFVGVEKGKLTFVRRRRGFRPSFVVASTIALPNDFWEKPDVDLIGRTLSGDVWSNTRASIVIADKLVRYFLVERPQGARNAREIELAAALRFEELYGEDARRWEIEIDLPPWASNYLACGIRDTHLALLSQVFAALHVPIKHISPFGIEQWNRHGRSLRTPNMCFLAVSSDTAWLALRRDRRWLSAYVHGLHDDRTKELPELIHRELTRHGLQEQWNNHAICIAGAIDKEAAGALSSARILSHPTWPDSDHLHADSHLLALSSVWPICK
ncbi:MAG: hypothetical protein IV101_07675 [Dechloromonas sp.]|nr:hypothetical protein [Dechloromonas sp.]